VLLAPREPARTPNGFGGHAGGVDSSERVPGLPAAARRAANFLFRNRCTGEITIGQFPNLPLAIFVAATAAEWLGVNDGTAGAIVDWVRVGSLGWWAGWELTSGVNPFRRGLGAAGLAAVAAQVVALVR
jgi:hypothetical protein